MKKTINIYSLTHGFFNSRTLKARYVFFIFLGCSFSQVEEVGSSLFSVNQNQQIVNVPYYSSQSIYNDDQGLERIIIVVHGQNRNANDYYNYIQDISELIGFSEQSFVFSPQFLLGQDLTQWNLDTTYAFWSGTTQWTGGYLSDSTAEHPRLFQISSFAIMDSIISHFLTTFQSIEEIVLAGHSAGGQFVNRYAAGSNINSENRLRFIVGAPSHYLYFDDQRSINNFQTPIVWSSQINCNGYNNYRYGLDNLNLYMNQSTEDTIKVRYSRKKVIYLVGALDYGGTTYCESSVQGSHRYNRSTVYFQHLLEMFNVGLLENQRVAIINGVSHDAQALFSSDCGVYSIFLSGNCEQISSLTFPQSLFTTYNSSGPYPLDVSFANVSNEGTHPIVSSIWDFGNGVVLNSNNTVESAQYNMPGEYSVSLTSHDLIGLKDSINQQTIIQVDTLFGEINWDSNVNEQDAILILKHTTNQDTLTELQQEVGDVNRDSIISPFDASLILRYSEGYIEELPFYQESSHPEGTLISENQNSDLSNIITIPIFADNIVNLVSFSLTLDFENSLLDYGSVYSVSLNSGGFLIEGNHENGRIYISCAGPLPTSLNGPLLDIYFTVAETFSEHTTLTFSNIIINEDYVVEDFEITINSDLSFLEKTSSGSLSIDQNYPNPFNSNTLINFSLDKESDVHIYINDLLGQKVKDLLLIKHKAGKGSVSWDGTNSENKRISSGIYYYTIETKEAFNRKKMVLIK